MEPIVDSNDVTESASVRSVATLVKFTTHAWGARAKDSDASIALAHLKNAKRDDVGTFTKELLAGADTEYKALVAVIREAKNIHQRMTLPYSKGLALLANDRIWEYTDALGKMKEEIREKRADFEAAYPAAMQKALENLGDLADVTKYPPADVVGGQFGIDIEFLPIPDGGDFNHLPPQFASALAQKLNTTIQERVGGAMNDGWKRLGKTITKLRTTLADPDTKRLFASSITNIQDMNRLVTDFNITNDPSHAAIVTLIDQTLCGRDMDKIRHSEILKQETVSACDYVLNEMQKAGFYDSGVVQVEADDDVRSLRTDEPDSGFGNGATEEEDHGFAPKESGGTIIAPGAEADTEADTDTTSDVGSDPYLDGITSGAGSGPSIPADGQTDIPEFPTLPDTAKGNDDVASIFRNAGLLNGERGDNGDGEN